MKCISLLFFITEIMSYTFTVWKRSQYKYLHSGEKIEL